MAGTGGRAARWVVRAAAAAAITVVATAGLALIDGDDGPSPGGVRAATTTAEPGPAAAGTAEAPVSSVAEAAPPTPAATSTPSWADDYATYPGPTDFAPFVSFIGDSWTHGRGATDLVGYAPRTGRLLGWEHRVLGVGGSGYVVGGRRGIPFDERIEAAVTDDPDLVVVQGSINEHGTPLAELRPAVAGTLDRLVAAAGADTVVVVVGASHVPGIPDAEVDPVNDTLRAEATRRGLRFVDVAAENWSDPGDPTIWADPTHVNDAGAQRIAERLAPVLRGVLAG